MDTEAGRDRASSLDTPVLWATRISGEVVGKCRSKVQEQFQSIILSCCPGQVQCDRGRVRWQKTP